MRNKPFEAAVAIPYMQKNNWDRARHQNNPETVSHTLAGETLSWVEL